jgi:Tfp pilus assembly protein PilV
MDTFTTLLAEVRGRLARRSATDAPSSSRACIETAGRAPLQGSSEDGFLLIEVIISALLVALIVVATFNGFDVVTRLTSDQRNHSEGSLVAAQSQEELRSDPATALDALESAAHVYTTQVDGVTYTVTQEAKPINSKESSTGCVATETTQENGANIQISSSVTWPQLVKAKRAAVKQTSIITPPVGSGLEVDVTNGGVPLKGVKGITAVAKFIPVGSGAYTSAEGTTGEAGCVVLTGLATTLATVEIGEKLGIVTTSGALKYPTKEVSIAPNITTQYPVTLAEGGSITAEFAYKGSTKFGAVPVTGDTFSASNTHIPAGFTPFEVGSTAFEYQTTGEEKYKSLTGTYGETATTPIRSPRYPHGDLFPFPSNWSVNAGDCPANKTSSEAEAGVEVLANKTVKVKVPMSYTELGLYTGNDAGHAKELVKEPFGPVKITNVQCESAALAANAFASNFVHEQKETASASGRLKNPFQPFGKYRLCVLAAGIKKTYTIEGNNTNAEGSKPKIYIGQETAAERLTQQETEEKAEAQLTKEETEAKKAKESREKEESLNRAKWAEEESKGKLSKTKRLEYEASQKATREATEKTEKTAKEKREEKEKALEATTKVRETEEKEEAANGVTVLSSTSC